MPYRPGVFGLRAARSRCASSTTQIIPRDTMIEILRTNDLILISVVSSLFDASNIAYFIADQHMSVLEGSTGFLPRRVMVERDVESRARRLLTDAGFADELRRG